LGSYTTGYTDGTVRVDDTIISTSTTKVGYAVIDLSSIPAGSLINSCTLKFYVTSFTAGTAALCNTYGYAGDLSTVTSPSTLFSDITSGTLLFSGMPTGTYSYGSGIDSVLMTATAAPVTSFIQANIGSKISVGFSGGGTYIYKIAGETGGYGNPPELTITYTPPCSGTPYSSITASSTTACATSPTTFTCHAPTGVLGIGYQWQSSPDSSTWSNIAGATNVNYVNSGITTNTYFRCDVNCSNSGLSAYTSGILLSYLSCCTGTPASETLSASTTVCDSCALVLTVSGYSAHTGLSSQIQESADSINWYNIPGGYNTTSLTINPSVAALYYRCHDSCYLSGLVSTSNSVFVDFPYRITTHYINYYPSSCGDPWFSVGCNGYSSVLFVKTLYGDGTNDSVNVIRDSIGSYVNTYHHYVFAGTYSIKQILYSNNAPMDSVKYSLVIKPCNFAQLSFYDDINGDCIMDSSEPFCRSVLTIAVDSAGYPIDTISTSSGINYKIAGPAGTIYSFIVVGSASPYYNVCPGSVVVYDTVQSTEALVMRKYIGLNCTGTGSTFDLSVHDIVPVTGVNDQWGDIYVSNYSCEPKNATVTLHYDSHYRVNRSGWLDVQPTPYSYTDSTITWLVNDLEFGESPYDLYYAIWSAPTGSPAPIGYPAITYVTVTPAVGDANPDNNAEMVIDTVRDGCDPNEMSVSPSGCVHSDSSLINLQYTINFTNVGNDTAFNINVMDTLSPYLDPKSLRIVLASDTMFTTILNDGTHNIVKFDFPGINLLDSAACPKCNGGIIYTINAIPGLPDGTTIANRAGVFFDYNPVVMTNTVVNTTGCINSSVKSISNSKTVQVYPNPTTGDLIIKADMIDYQSFTITNSMGQEILKQSITGLQTRLNIASLPQGLYFISFRGDAGDNVQKFVKL